MSIGTSLPVAMLCALALGVGVALGARRADRPGLVLAGIAGAALWALLCDLRLGAADRAPTLHTPGAPGAPGTLVWDPAGPARHRTLLTLPPSVTGLAVRGHGLPGPAWDEAAVAPTRHVPPPLPPGLRRLRWPEEVVLGEPFVVTGVAPAGTRRVALTAAGSVLAETEAVPGTDPARAAGAGPGRGDAVVRFELRYRPPAAGRVRAELVATGLDGPAHREPLAFTVVPPSPLTVQFHLGAPSFDVRALRDWLLAGGHVTGEARITLAPSIVRSERYGDGPVERPDLLLADGPALADAALRERLLAAVAGGAGLLVLHRGAALPPELETLLGGRVARRVEPEAARIATAAGALPVRLTGRLEPVADAAGGGDGRAARVLVRTGEGQLAVVSRGYGAGRLALSLLEGTAGWVTAGESRAHGEFWGELVRIIARPREAPLELRHGELVATVGLRTVVCRGATEPPVIEPAPMLPLLPTLVTPDWRCDAWWPARPGWHRIDGQERFVYPLEAFAAERARTRTAATAARLRPDLPSAGIGHAPLRTVWWFAFLLAATSLFVRARLRDT